MTMEHGGDWHMPQPQAQPHESVEPDVSEQIERITEQIDRLAERLGERIDALRDRLYALENRVNR